MSLWKLFGRKDHGRPPVSRTSNAATAEPAQAAPALREEVVSPRDAPPAEPLTPQLSGDEVRVDCAPHAAAQPPRDAGAEAVPEAELAREEGPPASVVPQEAGGACLGPADATVDEGEPLDLGTDPRDPLIFELVTRNGTSVRLRNAIVVARGRGELPFNRVSAYLEAGEQAAEAMRTRISNLGRVSVAELDALVRRAAEQMAFEPQPSAASPLRRDLRTALANLVGPQSVRDALSGEVVPVRLWNAFGRRDLLSIPLSELLLQYGHLQSTLLRMPNVGRKSYLEGRRVLGELFKRRLLSRRFPRSLLEDAECVVLDSWEADPRTRALLEAELGELGTPSDGPAARLSLDDVRAALASRFSDVTTESALSPYRPPARLLGALEQNGYLNQPLERWLLEYADALSAMRRLGNFGATSARAAASILGEILRAELAKHGFDAREAEIAQLALLEAAQPASDDFDVLCRRVAAMRNAASAESPPAADLAGVVSEPAASLLPRLLAKLAERERDVLERRYGLYAPPLSLEEVGVAHGVTRERIRQIEKKALGRLRQMAPKRLAACCRDHGGEAWSALAGEWPFVLVHEVGSADRRVSPWMLLAIEACGLNVPGWLDGYAQRRDGYWLARGAPFEALEAAAERMEARLATQPRPCAVAQLIGPEEPELARAALRLHGARLYGDYVMPPAFGTRLRRAVRLHSLLASGGRLKNLAELMADYRVQAADDPCSTRDAELAMQACRHLFVETTEGCWAAVGASGATPVASATDQQAEDPDGATETQSSDEAAQHRAEEAAAAERTIASALEGELRTAGPLRISELQDRAPRFLPPGRSRNSLGPILVTYKDRFARPLPGFYALPQQVPSPAQLLARAPDFMLQEDQVRYYVFGRRAAEPRDSYPLWSIEAEYAFAQWARRHAEPVLLESFLAVAEPDAWPPDVADRADWVALKAARGKFGLAYPPVTDGVARPELDKLFAACLHARRHGGLGWISANRILWRRVTEFAAAGMLAMMVAAGLLEPADDWQAPHRAGPELEPWIARLEDALASTGSLTWDTGVGEQLLSTTRAPDLGWAEEAFVTALFGRSAPVRDATPEDPLAQLLAERARARRTSEFEAKLRAASRQQGDEG